jgi:hypothetical protein
MKTGHRGEIRDGLTSARTPETEEAVARVVEEQLSLRNVDDGRNLRASSCLNSFMEKTYTLGGGRRIHTRDSTEIKGKGRRAHREETCVLREARGGSERPNFAGDRR